MRDRSGEEVYAVMDEEEREKRDDSPPEEHETPTAVNPWRDIFVRPRATTRWLLANETEGAALWMWLSCTALFIVILFLGLTFYPGSFDRAATRMQLVIFTPLIFLASWVYFVIQSHLLSLLGNLAGGRATVGAMRVVNAYTTVIPTVVFGLVRLGLLLAFGREGTVALIVSNILLVWTFWISLGSIAAAAQLSSWRAMGVYVATVVFWMAAVSVAVGALQALGVV